MNFFLQLIIAFIFGGTFSLGFPNVFIKPIFIFPLISFFGLFYLWNLINNIPNVHQFKIFQKKLFIFLSFCLGATLFCYYWIAYTMVEFGALPKIVAYILNGIYAFLIFPQGWVFLLIDHFVFITKFREKIDSLKLNLILAFLFSIIEFYLPQQFPNHIGHTYLSLAPYIGLAPIFGVPVFSFISYWAIFETIDLFLTKRYSKLFLTTLILFIVINSAMKLKKGEAVTNLNIRLVQANIGNYMKVQAELGDPNSFRSVIDDYLKLSHIPNSNEFNLDLIIWPETAYPEVINSEFIKSGKQKIPSVLKDITQDKKSYLFIGGYDFDNTNKVKNPYFEKEFNTAFLLNKNSEIIGTYHKQKLLSFGETLPFGSLNEKLSEIITNVSYFAKGKGPTLFELSKNGTPIYFISAICYEILFPELIQKQLNSFKTQANFIINLTNDSWYGDSVEPYQHLFLAHWRALEFQVPVIRSTNTGVTSILYPDGSESSRIGLFEKRVLEISLPITHNSITIFQKYGILSYILLWMMIFLFSFIKRTKKISQ